MTAQTTENEMVNEAWARTGGRLHASDAAGRTILLISDDRDLHSKLKSFANRAGHMVVRHEGTGGIVAVLRAVRPAAVVLDLDLPEESAWAAADLLLQQPGCPPLTLLTGRTDQFDLRTAIRAGSLVSKNASPAHLFELIEKTFGASEINQAERNAIQRILIGWLKPSTWAGTAPAHRFWGINE